jgi:peptide/nickel transport system permease protein
MRNFLIRRLFAAIPLVLAVTFLTQLLLFYSQGDYVTRLEEDPTISAEHLSRLRTEFGLDGGFWERYARWLGNAVRGNLGFSFENRIPVFDLVIERMGNTLLLMGCAMAVSWLIALPLGIIAAVKRNHFIDKISGVFSFIGLSIPSVFFALLALMFAAKTGWFPTGSIHNQILWDDFNWWQKIIDVAHHLVLPTLVIGTIGVASYMRFMRANMVETLSQDYIRTARAKGLSRRQVLFKHAFGNAVNPLITLFGFSLSELLAGSFLVEIVLSWPGMARLTVSSLFAKDVPVVMAAVVMSAVLLIVGNLVADVLLAIVDPRIRLQ